MFWRKRDMTRDLSCLGSCLTSCDSVADEIEGLVVGEEKRPGPKWSLDQI